ncbi:MAG TPA: DUF5060 domain-containing protein [Draconibacterium sp.]|nr:DUF5060 domain-containing protein [Draconibacterium sp.]
MRNIFHFENNQQKDAIIQLRDRLIFQKRHIILALICLFVTNSFGINFNEREATMWLYEEWTLENRSWTDNPFDVVAVVTFVHGFSGERHNTEMFYAGENKWKFRFTGIKEGRWIFSTLSSDVNLNGHFGSVMVKPRTNSNIKGFLTSVGNKFAIMEENIDHLNGYVYQVFMNQQDYEQQYDHHTRILSDPGRSNLIKDYWNNTQDNGFNIYFFSPFYSWFRMGALSINDFSISPNTEKFNPDPELFDILEEAINCAHQSGGRTHIWAWGDNDRKQTPNFLPDGLRGKSHRRLIRYIAARLGPLPGWTMSFGFDTFEMPNVEEDCAWWADELNKRMGWPHILTSRGWENESFGANSYAGFGGPYDLTASATGPSGYHEIKQHLETKINKPSIYEERHTYNRWKCWPHSVPDSNRLNETNSRRLIWWEVMAGGMGGFFGHFSERFNAYGPFNPNGPCGYYPESLKLAFRTYREFWKNGRLQLSMSPDNQRVVSETNGYCLSAINKKQFVFFIEEADSVLIDLNGMPGSQPIFSIDTKKTITKPISTPLKLAFILSTLVQSRTGLSL